MIGERLNKAINDQIKNELESYYIYLSMAAYFEDQNLEGFGQWMQIQAREEFAHAMKIYSFIQSRGGRVVLGALEAPQHDWDSPLAAFSAALDHERMITSRINVLLDLANEVKDNATHQFLMWFVAEQVEEEETASRVVDRLKLMGDAPGGLFIMDNELGSRVASAPE